MKLRNSQLYVRKSIKSNKSNEGILISKSVEWRELCKRRQRLLDGPELGRESAIDILRGRRDRGGGTVFRSGG